MSRSSYGIHTCRCGKQMKGAGFAIHAHKMAHVRRGEMVVIQSNYSENTRIVWPQHLDQFEGWWVKEDHREQS